MFNEFKKGFGNALGGIAGMAAGFVGLAVVADYIKKKRPDLFKNENEDQSSTEENESYI